MASPSRLSLAAPSAPDDVEMPDSSLLLPAPPDSECRIVWLERKKKKKIDKNWPKFIFKGLISSSGCSCSDAFGILSIESVREDAYTFGWPRKG